MGNLGGGELIVIAVAAVVFVALIFGAVWLVTGAGRAAGQQPRRSRRDRDVS